jgi:hypothetical protein
MLVVVGFGYGGVAVVDDGVVEKEKEKEKCGCG